MANWKKVIVSGSEAELGQVSASIGFSGSFFGDGAGLTGVAGEFPTSHDTDAVSTFHSLKFFVNDGSSRFVSGSQISASVYGGVHGDLTIAADGNASISATLIDTASVVKITQAPTDPQPGGVAVDPIFLVGTNANGNGQNLYSLNEGGLTVAYDTSDEELVIGGNLKVGDGTPSTAYLSSSATTFEILPTTTTTINIGDAATQINLGKNTGNVRIKGSASIDGDLIVKGTRTDINVTNLNVEDQLILLNSSSVTDAANPQDGGIIVQTSGSVGQGPLGTALYYDKDANRWALVRSSSAVYDDTALTADQYLVSVSQSAAAPTTQTSYDFGVNGTDSTLYGQMYVDTSDSTNGGLYIYLP